MVLHDTAVTIFTVGAIKPRWTDARESCECSGLECFNTRAVMLTRIAIAQ